jgi:hypothetical protein
MAWRQDPIDLYTPSAGTKAKVFPGIYNASGIVSEVSNRQGVITYVDAGGELDIYLDLCSCWKNIMEFKVKSPFKISHKV